MSTKKQDAVAPSVKVRSTKVRRSSKLKGESFAVRQQKVERDRSRALMYRRALRLKLARANGKSFGSQLSAEERYEVAHHRERARRLASAINMDAVMSVSPIGGYWKLGNTKTHTPTCILMAGKNWSWSVLEKVNPQREHAGCGCRIMPWRDGAEHRAARSARKAVNEIAASERLNAKKNRDAARSPGPIARLFVESLDDGSVIVGLTQGSARSVVNQLLGGS